MHAVELCVLDKLLAFGNLGAASVKIPDISEAIPHHYLRRGDLESTNYPLALERCRSRHFKRLLGRKAYRQDDDKRLVGSFPM